MAADLSLDAVKDRLTGRFGKYVRYFDEIASTNTEALGWAVCGGPEGSVVVADHQTGGRGRWGRSWFSIPGKLLQFSLILRPDLDPSRHGVLTAGIGVACAHAIRDLSGLPARIKWPNDIVVENRKLAGMLVESSLMGDRIAVAVCGIGINVGLSEEEIPEELRARASSLAIEVARTGTGRVPDRAELLAAIVERIETGYSAFSGGGSTGLMADATDLSAILGSEVVVRFADGTSLEGRAEGFDPDGALRVRSDANVRSLHVGEIEQLRAT